MEITAEIIDKVAEALKNHLTDYHNEIAQAYEKNGDELSVSFSVKMAHGKKGGVDYVVEMSFVKERVKVKSVGNFDKDQLGLPFRGQE